MLISKELLFKQKVTFKYVAPPVLPSDMTVKLSSIGTYLINIIIWVIIILREQLFFFFGRNTRDNEYIHSYILYSYICRDLEGKINLISNVTMEKLFTNKGGLLKILDAYDICMYIYVCRHEEFVLQVICINNCGY